MINIKITKNTEEATAITHGGTFHADEVFATVILSKMFDNMIICRTFEVPENISDNVIVYDIGHGKYDHHQKGGNGERANGVPYAACGLIWKEFGAKVLNNIPNLKMVWELVDKNLIQGIDARDNGKIKINNFDVQVLNISNIISIINPPWDSDLSYDNRFIEAVELANKIFEKVLENAIAISKAHEAVEKAINNSENGIMILDKFLPWQESFFASENKKPIIFSSLYSHLIAEDITGNVYRICRVGSVKENLYRKNGKVLPINNFKR